MRKGLEFTEVTQLRRETNPNQKDALNNGPGDDKDKKGGMIFINIGGLSINFP